MKRVPTAELLDVDAGTSAEIFASVRDLDRINRWFGGIHTSQALVGRVARVAGLARISLLEVAAGSGNTAVAVQQRLDHEGLRIDLTLLDRADSHFAKGAPDSLRSRKFVSGDALHLPFRDESFDVVSCNLFVHHLSPQQVVQFVLEALRVCRQAVVINDVSRSWLHLAFVYLGMPLFRSRITWHDAPASVRQAYTSDEIKTLLDQSNTARVEIGSHFLFRIGAIAWKSGQDESRYV